MNINSLSDGEINSGLSVCRLCIQFSTDYPYSIKCVKPLINNVLPSLDLTLTNNPVVCLKCVNLLSDFSNFKNMCIEKEKKIQEYYEKTKYTVDLHVFLKSEQISDNTLIRSTNSFKKLCEVLVKNTNIRNQENCEVEEILINNQSEVPPDRIISESEDNAIEILESDINSDIDLYMSDEPNCKMINLQNKNDDLESDKIPQRLLAMYNSSDKHLNNIEEIKNNCTEVVDSDTESKADSDMIFIEECNYDRVVMKNEDADSTMDSISVASSFSAEELIKSSDHSDSNYFKEEPGILYDCSIYKNDAEESSQSSSKESLKPNRLSEIFKKASKAPRNKRPSQLHQKINSNLFKCILCFKTFSKKIYVDAHLLSNHKDIPYIENKIACKIYNCQHCPYRTVHRPMLAKHLSSKHNMKISRLKQFKCEFCHKMFYHKQRLDGHLLTQHKAISNIENKVTSMIHYCQECSYRTVYSNNLSRHLASKHHNSQLSPNLRLNLYSCEFCHKMFSEKLSLDGHLLTKHKDIPYIEKKVTSILAKHLASKHNDSQLHLKLNSHLYRCKYCHKTFSQKVHLDGHLLTKHEDIPNIEKKVASKIHYCHYCSYRTIKKCYLARHLIVIHNKNI